MIFRVKTKRIKSSWIFIFYQTRNETLCWIIHKKQNKRVREFWKLNLRLKWEKRNFWILVLKLYSIFFHFILYIKQKKKIHQFMCFFLYLFFLLPGEKKTMKLTFKIVFGLRIVIIKRGDKWVNVTSNAWWKIEKGIKEDNAASNSTLERVHLFNSTA